MNIILYCFISIFYKILLTILCFSLIGRQLLQAFDIKGSVEINTRNVSRRWYAHSGIFTWMGVLVTKNNKESTEEMLRSSVQVILISDGVAIGMAKQLAHRSPDACEAMFWLADGRPWSGGVEKITPHHADILALVFLIPPVELLDFSGLGVAWSRSNIAPNPTTIVGIEQNLFMNQFQKEVVLCNEKQDRNNNIDTRPGYDETGSACYHEMVRHECTYRIGMALIVRTLRGEYNLFAIGIGGPGCSSSSLWVRFHPYHEWVHEHTAPKLRATRGDDGMFDYYEDLDQHLITKLYKDKTRSQIQWTWNNKEVVEGNCYGDLHSRVYREQMHFITNRDSTYASYALSLYDLRMRWFSCVTLWPRAPVNRSSISWTEITGFQQDDIEYYIKKVPISTDGYIKPKIVFLIDKWRKYYEHKIKVRTLEFQFVFDQEVELEIEFWGKY